MTAGCGAGAALGAGAGAVVGTGAGVKVGIGLGEESVVPPRDPRDTSRQPACRAEAIRKWALPGQLRAGRALAPISPPHQAPIGLKPLMQACQAAAPAEVMKVQLRSVAWQAGQAGRRRCAWPGPPPPLFCINWWAGVKSVMRGGQWLAGGGRMVQAAARERVGRPHQQTLSLNSG